MAFLSVESLVSPSPALTPLKSRGENADTLTPRSLWGQQDLRTQAVLLTIPFRV